MTKRISPKLTIGLMYFLFYIGVGAYFPLYMGYLEEFVHMSPAEIGNFAAIGPLLAVGFVPLSGAIIDKIRSPKAGVVTVFVLTGLCTFAIGFFKSASMVGFFVTMQGMLRSPVNPTMDNFVVNIPQKYGVDYSATKKYGAIGRAISGMVAGGLIGLTTPNAFIYLFAATFFIAAFLFFITPCKSGDEIGEKDSGENKVGYFKQVFQLVKRSDYLYMILLFAIFFSLGDSFNVYLNTNLKVLNTSTVLLSTLTIFIALPEFVVLPLLQKLMNKMKFSNLVFGILILQALRFAVYYFTGNSILFLIVTILNSFAISACSLFFFRFTQVKIPGNLSATGLSLATTIRALFTSLIMKICGNLYAASGKIQNVYLVAFAIIIIMAVVSVLYFRKNKSPIEEETAVEEKEKELEKAG